jgi:hypothetical protein
MLYHLVISPPAALSRAGSITFHSTKCPDQRATSVDAPAADNRREGTGILKVGVWPAAIAPSRQCRLELVFDHCLDEAAHQSRKPASIGSEPSSRSGIAMSDSDCRTKAFVLS